VLTSSNSPLAFLFAWLIFLTYMSARRTSKRVLQTLLYSKAHQDRPFGLSGP
jgi:hypothetical protein